MQKIKFSNTEILPYDIWFLENTRDFCERKLLLGKTQKNKTVVSLIETRITDSKVFADVQVSLKAEKIIQNERNRVLYTRQELILSRKGLPFGWTYGDNKEVRNRKGEVVKIKQFRCDYYGQKELIHTKEVEKD